MVPLLLLLNLQELWRAYNPEPSQFRNWPETVQKTKKCKNKKVKDYWKFRKEIKAYQSY